MTQKELYSEIEYLIIMWSNDDKRTAGSLTREIMELIEDKKPDTRTMEKLIESNRKFDDKNKINYNPNDRSDDTPNITNFLYDSRRL